MNITMIEGDQRNHKSYQCHSRYSTIDNNTAQYTIQYNTMYYDTIQKQNITTQYNTTTHEKFTFMTVHLAQWMSPNLKNPFQDLSIPNESVQAWVFHICGYSCHVKKVNRKKHIRKGVADGKTHTTSWCEVYVGSRKQIWSYDEISNDIMMVTMTITTLNINTETCMIDSLVWNEHIHTEVC